MMSTSNYGLDDLYRSMSLAEENEREKSIMFEELYRASPVAQKVTMITEPTFRSPKALPSVSLKAKLFNQLKTLQEKDPGHVSKNVNMTVKPSIEIQDKSVGERHTGDVVQYEHDTQRSCDSRGGGLSLHNDKQGGSDASLMSHGGNFEEDTRKQPDTCHNEKVEDLHEAGVKNRINVEMCGAESESEKENSASTRHSIENQETTEEPVKNLMSAFLLTSTSARYRSSDKLPENVLQNKGPDHHSIRRVEAVNPFHHKKDGNQIEENIKVTEQLQKVQKEKRKDPKVYKLNKWIVRLASSGGLIVEGHKRGDDPEQMWHSSSIVQRISNRKVSTAGGSIYILLGPMDKREAQEQSVPNWLVKIFKDGFPVEWKELLQQKNETRIQRTSMKNVMDTTGSKSDQKLCVQLKSTELNAGKEQYSLNIVEEKRTIPQVNDPTESSYPNEFKSPSMKLTQDTEESTDGKVVCGMDSLKLGTPSHGRISSKLVAGSASVKREKGQSSFLHYKQGDVVSFEDLPKTRSGRKIVPQLSWWTGQRMFTDKCNTTTVTGPFSPEVSALDVTVEVSQRQERYIQRARKNQKVLSRSKVRAGGQDSSQSECINSSIESDINSLPNSSCVDSDLGEDSKVKHKTRSSRMKGSSMRKSVRSNNSVGTEQETMSSSSTQKEEPVDLSDGKSGSSGTDIKGSVRAKSRKRWSKIISSDLESNSSQDREQKQMDGSSTPKQTAESVHQKHKIEEKGKFSVRKTRSMTALKKVSEKPVKVEKGRVDVNRGEKRSRSVDDKSRKPADEKSKSKQKNGKNKTCVLESDDSFNTRASRKRTSSKHPVSKSTKGQTQEPEEKKLVKDDVLLNSSLFMDSSVTPQNTIVCEEDFLSVDSSQFDVRSDIMGMLEERRKVRLSSKPQRHTCYNSPHVNVNNIVQTKNHSEKYYLKKALLHNVASDLKDKVAKDSPVVELVNMCEGNNRKSQKRKSAPEMKRTNNRPKQEGVAKEKKLDENKKQQTKPSRKRVKSKSKVTRENSVEDNIKSKSLTVIKSSQKMDDLIQPQKKAWTKQEIEQLRRATYKVPDYLPNYWELVARSVQTRTAEECYSYHYSSMRGGGTSGKKKTTKTHDKSVTTTLTGRVGTLKRKRELREIMENHNQDYDGDIFDSTPYRKNKRMKLDITENDDFFSHVDAMFTTPGVKGRGSWPLSEKTPIPKFVSPGILKDPNRNDADVYINRVKKAKHVFHKTKNALPATTSRPISRPAVTLGPSQMEVNSDWFKVQDEVEDDDLEESDLYFSDDTNA